MVGLGLMGHGIAQVSAQAGYEVSVVESNPEALAKGMARIDDSLNKVLARGVKKGKMSQEDADAQKNEVSDFGIGAPRSAALTRPHPPIPLSLGSEPHQGKL